MNRRELEKMLSNDHVFSSVERTIANSINEGVSMATTTRRVLNVINARAPIVDSSEPPTYDRMAVLNELEHLKRDIRSEAAGSRDYQDGIVDGVNRAKYRVDKMLKRAGFTAHQPLATGEPECQVNHEVELA